MWLRACGRKAGLKVCDFSILSGDPCNTFAQDKYLVRNYGLESFVAARRDCKAVLQKKLGLVMTPNAVSWQHMLCAICPIPISSIFFILSSIVASRRSFAGPRHRMCLVLKLRNLSNQPQPSAFPCLLFAYYSFVYPLVELTTYIYLIDLMRIWLSNVFYLSSMKGG